MGVTKRTLWNEHWIVINIPKNACTSLRLSIGLTVSDYEDIPDKEKKNYLIVIRDPYERFLSSYDQILKCNQRIEDCSESRVLNFLQSIKGGGFYEYHLYPQTDWLTAKGLKIDDIQNVVLFENLVDECKMLGINIELHENPTEPERKQKLQKALENPQIRELIKELYAKDIEMYEHIRTIPPTERLKYPVNHIKIQD